MKRKFFLFLMVIILPFSLSSAIIKLNIDGPIDTITEEYISDNFVKLGEKKDLQLVIIEIDTPGGYDTSMRSIIKHIMNSPVPVAVFVSPKGARAASAGFFITISADIASMAPGTNMGAAHPVAVGGAKIEDTMKEKITNDAVSYAKSLAKNKNRNPELSEEAVRLSKSFTAEECYRNHLIEYIAEDTDDLLGQLEGKEVVMTNGKRVRLHLQKMVSIPMSGRQKFLRTITNPNLAYFLLIFGLLGLYLEFTHPGSIIPGVLGGISLLLAFLAFQVLPINYVGLLLILLSLGLFIAEIKVQGFGMLGIGGIISFLLGSIILINAPIPEMRPTMSIIITFSVCFGVIILFLTYKVFKAMRKRIETGEEGLCGETGTARTDIDSKSGKIFIHGEWWNAVSDDPIPAGSRVKVLSRDNFILKVKSINHQE
jgi:membrane-bound serine protease (ClpP class)